jgi:Abnormal spindle-like microcephaly-assoc'd, ASPM-SPD-2-Hydin
MMGPADASRSAAPLRITAALSDFGKVPVGTYVSQVIQVSPTGGAVVPIKSLSVTGRDFSIVGLASAAEVPVSGAGAEAEIKLTASPAKIDFGTVSVGETKASTVTLKAAGNADLKILHIITSGRGFYVAGASAGTRLAPGHELALKVTFEPPESGVVYGSILIWSTASRSPIEVRLAGSALASSTKAPSVYLRWDASGSSGIVGYYVYRSPSQTGPFSKLDESPEASTSYTDTSVSPGTTYYYKVTSVDSGQVESSFSETVSARVPE